MVCDRALTRAQKAWSLVGVPTGSGLAGRGPHCLGGPTRVSIKEIKNKETRVEDGLLCPPIPYGARLRAGLDRQFHGGDRVSCAGLPALFRRGCVVSSDQEGRRKRTGLAVPFFFARHIFQFVMNCRPSTGGERVGGAERDGTQEVGRQPAARLGRAYTRPSCEHRFGSALSLRR